MKRTIAIFVLAAFAGAPPSAAIDWKGSAAPSSDCTAGSNCIVLENPDMRIHFAGPEHGFAVTGIVNRIAGDAKFVHSWGRHPDFWLLTFSRSDGHGSNVTAKVTNRAKAKARWAKRLPDGIDFHWDGLDVGAGDDAEEGIVDVVASVRLDPSSGMSRWTLSVENRGSRWALYETEYPSFSGIVKEGEGDVMRPDTALAGSINRGARWAPGVNGVTRHYPGYQMMMTAYNQGDAGLYIAAHDPDCRIKSYACSRGEYLRFITPVENAGVARCAAEGPRYPVVIGAYRGDWWTAAKIYRAWAVKQKWTRKGLMIDRADYPKSMADSHLWLVATGSNASISNILTKMSKAWPDVNLALEWTNWNFLPFDCNYPEFLPPRDGWAETLAYAKSLGILTMPYTNGRLWDQALASYRMFAEPMLSHDINGNVYMEHWRQGRSHFGTVCPAWRTYQDILCYFSTNIVCTYGAGSIYIDQVACSRPRPCYVSAHGHPFGGGTYWRDGYHAALERIHGELSVRGAPIMSEGMGESWMDVIDGYLNAYYPKPDQIPLFPAVYSGYATAFGCPMGPHTPVDAFFAMQARFTLWGCTPGWCNQWVVESEKYRGHAEALHACGRVRQAAAEFLAWGTLENEVHLDAQPSFGEYAWYELKHGKKINNVSCRLPHVFGNVWKNARGTAWAVALANMSETPQTVSFSLPCMETFAPMALPGMARASFKQNGNRAELTLPPKSFAVLRTVLTPIKEKGAQK